MNWERAISDCQCGKCSDCTIEKLKKENTRLREALEWYADELNYAGIVSPGTGPVMAKRARQALGKSND